MVQKGTISLAVGILLVVGGLNWGLVGLFNLDVVATVFGGTAALGSKVVYVLVGLAALYKLAKMVGVVK
ncbi:DUF378 domain-containing protein [Patescibacteria group bacterium]|nr:DUF378 domain-containing protein [Patescibacteria group bacterium]